MSQSVHYKTKGICPKSIEVVIEEGIITDVVFDGGCNGNLKGLTALVKGQKPEDVIEKIKGIQCGTKSSSCPDQLSLALEKILEK